MATKRKAAAGKKTTDVTKQTGKDVKSMLEDLNKKLATQMVASNKKRKITDSTATSKTVAKSVGEDLSSDVKFWIPTGIAPIDMLLGGGLPVGMITEFYGAPKCGKSTMACQICIRARQMGGAVIYIDTEHTLNKDRIKYLGVDLDDPLFIVLEPSTMEEGFRSLHALIKASKEIDSLKDIPFFLVVWDTLAFTVSEGEWDENGEFKHDMGKRAKHVRQHLRRLLLECSASNVAFLNLNHQTESLNPTGRGIAHSRPGGTAFKFGASLCVQMVPLLGMKERIMVDGNEKGDQLGHTVRFKLEHTRLSPAKREIETVLNFYTGFDDALTSLRYIKDPKNQVLEKRGNTYVVNVPGREEETLFSTGPAGEAKFIELWKTDADFKAELIRLMQIQYDQIVPWKNPDGVFEPSHRLDIGDDNEEADEEDEDLAP